MRIVKLIAENVQKLRAVEITPNGDIVRISGRNAAGKSSTLNCIWLALKNADAGISMPIRMGENKARIKLDLGEIVVERKFMKGANGDVTTSVTVENIDGARFPSPQRLLDSLIGAIAFDPLAFARMEPRKQFDELRRVSKLEVDIDALDALNAGDYAKRTDLNRDAKAKRAQVD